MFSEGISLRAAPLLLMLGLVTACFNEPHTEIGQSDTQIPQLELDDRELVREALLGTDFLPSDAPSVREYQAKLAEVLRQEVPILALPNLAAAKAKAQSVFLNHPPLTRYLRHSESGAPMRTEIMSVSPALPSSFEASENCAAKQCFVVSAYNFFNGTSLSALIDVHASRVIRFSQSREMRPDLSERLADVATAIAHHDPLVKKEIERHLQRLDAQQVSDVKALMASTKTALNNTFCERSRHLCAAPTFVLGSQALWVIVDLTDFTIAGLRWTNVGENQVPAMVTEKTLSNEHVFEQYCEQTNTIKRGDWQFEYQLTSSDGLLVKDVRFQGVPFLTSAKVVDWHVSYSKFDGFGYSDATGCPMFSSAVVVAFQGPEVDDIVEQDQVTGFAITQDFKQVTWPAPCNYRYQERYEFYSDGRFRAKMTNLGRGCGANGTYRPILRLSLPKPETGGWALQEWQDSWQSQSQEKWWLVPPSQSLFESKFSHRLTEHGGRSVMIQPSTGEQGTDDRAFFYTSVEHPNKQEGAHDLITLGSCCNTDFRQGPEKFITPAEPLDNQPLVFWYVPQMDNDSSPEGRRCWAQTNVVDGVAKVDTWPCSAGLTLVSSSSGVRQSE